MASNNIFEKLFKVNMRYMTPYLFNIPNATWYTLSAFVPRHQTSLFFQQILASTCFQLCQIYLQIY